MKLVKQNGGIGMPVMGMRDGQIGIITKWGKLNNRYSGCIVQRYKDELISLGAGEDEGWGDIYSSHRFIDSLNSFSDCYVRILQPGELLEV